MGAQSSPTSDLTMIGADIVVPKMWSFCGSKTRPAARPVNWCTLLLLACKESCPESWSPETKTVKSYAFAGQSSALQLPKRAQLLD